MLNIHNHDDNRTRKRQIAVRRSSPDCSLSGFPPAERHSANFTAHLNCHQRWENIVYTLAITLITHSQLRISVHFVSQVLWSLLIPANMTAPSPTSRSSSSPPSKFVSGHVSTMWFCRWPQSQEGDWARPHLCKFARHGPWPFWKRFSRDHVWRGRSKPGCQIVGSVTIEWLTTEADDQNLSANSTIWCWTKSSDALCSGR